MSQAQFRFLAELNDFLPKSKRGTIHIITFNGNQSVKHLIESLGVPHTEVNYILVNGESTHFGYIVQDGDEVEVFPISVRLDENTDQLSREPYGEKRFILDNHLGRLAFYLRMLGFDSLYRNDYQDEELALVASEEDRILLTRDRHLLMRNMISYGYWVRSKIPRQQLIEVTMRFNLYGDAVPFYRCMRCNGVLQSVRKEQVIHRLQPLTKRYFTEFRICPDCDQVYWRGSHYDRMQKFIDHIYETE